MADDEGGLRVNRTCSIALSEFEWRFTASGGPGGQHANRSNPKVELRLDVEAAASLAPHHRQRLLERLGPLVRIVVDDERSQARNRSLALERMRARLAEALRVERTRRPTAPTRASQQRRIEQKKRRGDLKRGRRPPESAGDD